MECTAHMLENIVKSESFHCLPIAGPNLHASAMRRHEMDHTYFLCVLGNSNLPFKYFFTDICSYWSLSHQDF